MRVQKHVRLYLLSWNTSEIDAPSPLFASLDRSRNHVDPTGDNPFNDPFLQDTRFEFTPVSVILMSQIYCTTRYRTLHNVSRLTDRCGRQST